MTLQEFIDKLTQQVEPIETSSQVAWWNLATSGDEKYSQEYRDSRIAYRKLFSSHKDYQQLLSFKSHSKLALNRIQTLLALQYKENQIPSNMIEESVKLETDIEAIYTTFRPNVHGTHLSNNDLKKILIESADSKKREAAWKASKLIGEQVEQQVKALIALRNQSARKAGFSDYYSMRLELQELDQTRLFEILHQLETLTTPHWKRYKSHLDQTLAKRFGIGVQDLCPWHYQDPFFQEAPTQELNLDGYYRGKDIVEISRRFNEKIGLPVDDILERSDLFEREKKNQHAFCICIDRNQDVRILCNIRDDEYWMGTQLHELGHAVYEKFIDPSLPYFLRTFAHTSTTEAIAMLFGRLSKNGKFLQEYCGVDAQKAHEIDKLVKRQNAANLLVFARWVLVMTHFERAMYQQPDIDLNKFWWDCVEKFQSVNRVPNRNKPDWAAKLHLACAPVYYQNYILGEMTASQLSHRLQQHLEKNKKEFFSSSAVGEWLKKSIFSQGAKLPWEQLLQTATNEALNPHYFALDLKEA